MYNRVCALAVLCLWLAFACDAALSGLYVDNGVDQTVLEHALTSQEKQRVEYEILNLLGLHARPRTSRASNLTASSASKFLYSIYRYKSALEPTAPAGMDLSPRDLRAIDQSDTIISFVSHGHGAGAVRHERGRRLWFDVSEVPVAETIVGSELRLYQTPSDLQPGTSFTISLYQLTSISKGGKELQFVDAVASTCDHEGWLSLNVSGPFTTWVTFPETNLGLYLSVHLSTHPGHDKQPEEIGIVLDNHRGGHEPFLVAFMKNPLQRPLHIREVRETKRRRKRVGDWESDYVQDSFQSDRLHWNHGSRSCQIHNLHVDFSELKWNNWIIAPEQFNAFFCSGECNFPLNAHVNPTNHAIVQTLAHLVKPWKVPKPCCAPTKLAPVSILHHTNDNTIIVTNYKEMIVKSCGCH